LWHAVQYSRPSGTACLDIVEPSKLWSAQSMKPACTFGPFEPAAGRAADVLPWQL
jgi:hypothetical protein